MSADFPIALLPIAIGDFATKATIKRMSAARNIRALRKINGSAKGKPYFAPTKPVLHKSTKRYGASRATFTSTNLM